MSTPLIAIVTAIYVAVSGTLAYQRRWGMALVFIAYALANVGLIWDLTRGGR